MGYVQLICFLFQCRFVHLFLYCNPELGCKKCTCLLFRTQNIHHHYHSNSYIAGFLHQCIYTLQYRPEDSSFSFAGSEMIIVLLSRLNLQHCYCIAMHVVWKSWPWILALTRSIHVLGLSCMYLPFKGSAVSF